MKFLRYLFLSGLFVLASGSQAPVGEYSAKVVLLEKLTRFVEWPSQNPNPGGGGDFLLGVVGQSPFGDELDNYFLNHRVKGRPVRVKYFKGTSDLRGCDLLFICASEKMRLRDILAKLGGAPTLTIGDTEGFAASGVMVNIVRDKDHLGFEVNLAAAKDRHFQLASGFLKVAKVLN